MKIITDIWMVIVVMLCGCKAEGKLYEIAVTGVNLNKTELALDAGNEDILVPNILPSNATDKTVTWSSSNTSVATVDAGGKVTAVAEGTAVITAKAGDKSASCVVTVTQPVTGITLNKTATTLTVGGTEQITVTVTPTNATDPTVTWSSNNPNVATVSSAGLIAALAEGIATITAKAGERTAQCTVTVTPDTVSVTGVKIDNPPDTSLTVGETWQLTATVTPSNATNKTVTWNSSDTIIATVSSAGLITAKAVGNATITITTQDENKTSQCAITVANAIVSVTGVKIDNPPATSLTVGATWQLTATITPSNATNKTVTWKSTNTNIATVSGTGLVTAKAEGTATITITTQDGNKTSQCMVTITSATVSVTSVQIGNPPATPLTIGDTWQLLATIAPSNATNKTVTWKSSDTNVVTVSSAGLITAKAEGTATITVTTQDGNKTAQCAVTITSASVSVTGIKIDNPPPPLTVGDTWLLTATVTPSNATNKTISWKSSDTNIASVGNNGSVTAKAEGSATITVTTQDGNKTATCTVDVMNGISDDINGIVINGIRWATRNVDRPGTFAANPEASGMFYQWNSKTGWPATGSVSGWNSNMPNGTTWNKVNDPSPAGWHVPSLSEIQKLLDSDNVISVFTTQNGVTGRKFTDKATGNTLFMPLAGYRFDITGALTFVSIVGSYWSSTADGATSAFSIYLDDSSADWWSLDYRYVGYPVRSVADSE